MTKPKYKPYWLVLLHTIGIVTAAIGVIALFVWAVMLWWWFPIVAVGVFFVLAISFVYWIDQEGLK